MQVFSSSYAPHLSPVKVASPCHTSASPLFLRRPSKSLEQSITDEKAIPMFLSPEPQSKRVGICALPSVAASPICTPTTSLSLRIHSESTSSLVTPTDNTMAPDTTMPVSMASLPPTPTWIAIPPTPPYKNMRRYNTASRRRSSLILFTPSTSFPTAASPTTRVGYVENSINTGLKRCTSVPLISSRVQPISNPLPSGIDGRFVHTSPKNYAATISMVDETFGPESDPRSPAKLFHLSSVPVIDNEDGGSPDISCLPDITSPEGSWSDHSVDDLNWGTLEESRDALRKFYALKELLVTEVGYLKDLKALVTVYLRNLPTLAARALPSSSTFGRASSSFTAGPWVNSYTQLQATTLSSTPLPEAQNASSSTSLSAKESSKFQSRYLFTDSEIEALTRNAEELFQLHEHFVRELRAILEPLSFTMDQDQDDSHQHIDNLDAAIQAVSTKFATEASRFNAYQSFCAGHPEALDIVRKALQQFPLELDAFEQRCATMVFDMFETNFAMSEPGPNPSCDSPDSTTSQPQSQSLMVEDRKRAKSLTSLDDTARPLLSRPSVAMTKDFVVFPSEARRDRGVRRIAFSDYLIKPIQRICKYPLLLDQLLPSKALRTSPEGRSDVHVVVESAAQAMRHVATLVDEARHKQDIATQSSHIFSRISLGLASASALSSPLVQILTPDFLSSLGTCVLSGSLDVMHYHPTRPLGQTLNIKAKYLGAFLYSGGYLILVKVCKGRKYVPRHWFSLIDFEVSDVEDDAMLPCSIRLSSGEQHFELAAACKREKDSWLCSINESLTHAPTWNQEPTPSFKFDGKGELLPGSDDGQSESPSGLPTIRSIPEFGNTSETEFSEPFFASLRGHVRSKKKRRAYEVPHPPSRRSSSTSVKAIFSPITSDIETVVIRRSSPTARLQVDQELQDVISQACLTARSYAFTHEQELFQAPKANKSGFSRSNSGLSMAGMGRLSKHESVRVPRRRTTESFDSSISKGSSPFEKRTSKKLSITSVSLKDYDNNTSQTIASSPRPSSPSSRAATLLSSDNTISILAAPLNNKEPSPLKPRSFVRNVKDLFHFRPMSPVPPVSVIISHPSQNWVRSPSPLSDQSLTPNTIPPRWKVGSLRRRARSEPDNSSVTIPDDSKKSYSTQFTKAVTSLST